MVFNIKPVWRWLSYKQSEHTSDTSAQFPAAVRPQRRDGADVHVSLHEQNHQTVQGEKQAVMMENKQVGGTFCYNEAVSMIHSL